MLINNIYFDSKEEELYNPSDTLMYGIAFKNLYTPYKNYKPFQLIPHNPKEDLILKIYQLDQIINDLNLYLDINNKNNNYYNLFKKYNNNLYYLKEKYSNLYGPLVINETNYENYQWNKNPWPWESDGSIYV